jgi:hypothetical protein
MLSKLVRSVLAITLFFALQISGVARVYAVTGKSKAAKTSENGIKQSVRHDQLIAETGESVHLPVLQLTVQQAAFLTTGNLVEPKTGVSLYLGTPLSVPGARFYRLILFPFHGFW